MSKIVKLIKTDRKDNLSTREHVIASIDNAIKMYPSLEKEKITKSIFILMNEDNNPIPVCYPENMTYSDVIYLFEIVKFNLLVDATDPDVM